MKLADNCCLEKNIVLQYQSYWYNILNIVIFHNGHLQIIVLSAQTDHWIVGHLIAQLPFNDQFAIKNVKFLYDPIHS